MSLLRPGVIKQHKPNQTLKGIITNISLCCSGMSGDIVTHGSIQETVISREVANFNS